MINVADEFLGPDKWPSIDYKTYNHPENSFPDLQNPEPLTTDHIFVKTNSLDIVQSRIIAFDVDTLKTACKPTSGTEKVKAKDLSTDQCPTYEQTLVALNLTQCGSYKKTEKSSFSIHWNGAQRRLRKDCDFQNRISLSDHEPVTATIRIKKLGSNSN